MMRLFRLSPRVYLERFEAEALLLVADRDRLLTVNTAAAELYAGAIEAFGGKPFSLADGSAWLAGHYELDAHACRAKARGLLAFALKHGLARRTVAKKVNG